MPGVALEPRPSRVTHRRPDIQGLRAVAVLMVMAYHAGLPVYGGFTGVDVFFVISGFVITSLLVRELDASGRLDLRRFYTRRVRRLLPALALVLTVTGLVAVVVLSLEAQRLSGRTGVAASVFLANFEIMRSTGGYFAPRAEDNAFLHTWSLSVEEQFYLAFPALLLLGWVVWGRRWGPRRAAVVATAAVALGSFALSLYLSRDGALPGIEDPQEFAFYSSPTRAWQFAGGALLALLWGSWRARRDRLPRSVVAAMFLLGAGLIGVAALFVRGSGFPGVMALVPTAGAALVIATGDRADLPLASLLTLRPMVLVGDLSYSLYLWHWPVLVLGSAALLRSDVWITSLLVLASVVPAYVSYRWIEDPIRRADRLRGRRVLALVVTCVATPAVVSASLAAGASNWWGNPELQRWEQLRTETPLGRANGCHSSSQADGDPPRGSCVFGEGQRGTVLLVGDSHADALSDSVVAAAQAAGYRVVVRTTNGCPFISDVDDWTVLRRDDLRRACEEGAEHQWSEISSLRPDLVVIANRSPWYVDQRRDLGDREVTALEWGAAIKRTLARVDKLGAPALLVNTVPEHATGLGECVHAWGVSSRCASIERSYVDSQRDVVMAAEELAVASSSRAESWDPAEVLCDDSICVRTSGRTPIYLDKNHVNPSARVVLAPVLEQTMRRLARG